VTKKANKQRQETTPFERKKLCPKVGENLVPICPFASPRPWARLHTQNGEGQTKEDEKKGAVVVFLNIARRERERACRGYVGWKPVILFLPRHHPCREEGIEVGSN
jgi:hypothetical protein